MTEFAGDITRRARWALARNDGHPNPVWSTGEKLTVALVLGDDASLAAEGYTWEQAHEPSRRGHRQRQPRRCSRMAPQRQTRAGGWQ